MIIGDRLRALREEKKFSQGDIEKRTGLLRCYISRVENGHTVPAIETLEKWPAHLRSLSTNSSTKARNRLSCPISRNARLRAGLPGAAPAKAPVFWPSSAGWSAHGSEDGPAVVLPSEYRHYRGKISLDIHKVPAAEFAHASEEHKQSFQSAIVGPNEARPFPRSALVPKI